MREKVDPNWVDNYSNLKEYYLDNYPEQYFNFSELEFEIDPMEPFEEIEAYSVEKQREEILKCAEDFSYFCHKYVKITHPIMGLLPFILFRYQTNVIEEYNNNRFNIISKFRQGGLTTVTVLWSMWRCLFKLNETIMILSKSDREAIAAGEIVKGALEELPSWMKPDMSKNNDHQRIFDDTGCKMFFYTPEAARGRAITYLILDEAAFIPNMDKYWKAMFPTISTGGRCISISTVNGVGNWYYDIYQGALKGDNDFNIIELDYWEHPDYNDNEWVKATRAQLGEKGWLQEVMRDFLGAGDSYIPPEIITDLEQEVLELPPARMLFPEWNNQEEAKKYKVKDAETWVRGALHVWKDPIEGRDYIIGVDCAEGQGEEADNSCFQIIDQNTCEQIAEFYSNTCPPHTFSQILAMTGEMYNNALIVVESQNAGITILSKLQYEYFYENIFHNNQGGKEQAGIKTTRGNRPMFLEGMQTRLLNKSLVVKSRRFIDELKNFIYNKQTRRAEAAKGFHDDAIMAYCLALYARGQQVKHVPLGYETPEEMTETFKAKILEDIKAEFSKDRPEDWLLDDFNVNDISVDSNEMSSFGVRRKNDSLLREFGW